MSRITRREATRAALLLVLAPACKRERVFACTDESGLSSDDVMARHIVEYTDATPQPGKDCVSCAQYVKPAGDGCGGCKLIKGPVHPRGYCKVFAPIV